jgi:hypothetical protein
MKTRLSIAYLIAGLLALLVLGVSAEKSSALSVELLSTFDYPGDVTSTQPQKINDNSVVVGVFLDVNGVTAGFLRLRKGVYSEPLIDPNDTGSTTQGRGINNSLLVCGDYLDAGSGNFHGFFLHGSTFHDFDVPGSSWTIILGLNNAGDYSGSDIPASGVQSGFVSIGGVITEFTIPNASNTLAYQINASGQAAGYYIDSSDGLTHGYYRDSDGSIVSPIDPAGSVGTIVFGNNDKNWIVGRYADAGGLTHGFVFIPPDQYLTYDFPGSTFTSLNGINKRGLIVGRYLDASGIEHGILTRLTNTASDRVTTGTIPQRQTAQPTSQPVIFRAVEPAL